MTRGERNTNRKCRNSGCPKHQQSNPRLPEHGVPSFSCLETHAGSTRNANGIENAVVAVVVTTVGTETFFFLPFTSFITVFMTVDLVVTGVRPA